MPIRPTLPIPGPDPAATEAARRHQAQLTKPSGSLGQLEAVAITLAGLQGHSLPQVDPVSIIVFGGDHGVASDAGVSAYPQAVTAQMVANIAAEGAAISVLAGLLGARLEVVNLGTVQPVADHPRLVQHRIAPATADFRTAAAMTETQMMAALEGGRAAVDRAITAGAALLVLGEMGIGNTTAATAMACALLDQPAAALTGAGTGVDAAGLARKQAAIEQALTLHSLAAGTPAEILRCLGGFEIAALVGALQQAARAGVAVLVDGYIVTAAALLAVRLEPELRPWLLFAHRSGEPGHRMLLAALDATPLLDLGMRLGEGSGAAVAVPLLRAACALHAGMATFGQAGVANRKD